MTRWILILSLAIIPFYEVFLYFFMPERVFPNFTDMRITKDFVAIGFSLVIGSLVLCKYGFKRVRNIWIPIFLTFLVWNMYKAPGVFRVDGIDFAGMWDYKPAYQVFVYFFLFLGVSNARNLDVKTIFKVIAYAGLAMALLMLLQRLGADQIFKVLPPEINKGLKLPEMGGSLGQVTLSAPFIVMCIPFMNYLKKWFFSGLMLGVVVLSGSSFAMLGASVVVLGHVLVKIVKHPGSEFVFVSKTWRFIVVGSSIVILSVICGLAVWLHPELLQCNGRLEMWGDVFKEIVHGRIILTGAGIGGFRYLFALKHQSVWQHAHNEYLQLVWACGIIGFGIVFMMVKGFAGRMLREFTEENATILVSCVGLAAICLGTFPLQLAVYQYYAVVMAGIVYSNTYGGKNGLNL